MENTEIIDTMVDNRNECIGGTSRLQAATLDSGISVPKNVCRFHKIQRMRQNSLPTFPSSDLDLPDGPSHQDLPNGPDLSQMGIQNSSQARTQDLSQMGTQDLAHRDTKDSSPMGSDTCIPDSGKDPDHSILFQTASRILHTRDFDPDVPVTRFFSRGGRSFSDSGPPPDTISDQPKILYRKRSKQFVIRLPSGQLLDGKWVYIYLHVQCTQFIFRYCCSLPKPVMYTLLEKNITLFVLLGFVWKSTKPKQVVGEHVTFQYLKGGTNSSHVFAKIIP